MRRSIVYLLTILLFTACNKTKEVVEQKHEDGSPKIVATYKDNRIFQQVEYYENGSKKITGEFSESGKRQGHWQYWYENGNLWSECDYKEGIRHGENIVYYENGKKRFSGKYDNDKKVGKWSFWKEDGTLAKEQEF